jgi:hypothetical protein
VAGTSTHNRGFDPNGQVGTDSDDYVSVGDTVPTSRSTVHAESVCYSAEDPRNIPIGGDSVDYAAPYESVAANTGGPLAEYAHLDLVEERGE